MHEPNIRRITALAATAALAASLAAAMAGPVAAADGPKKDFVAGGGQNLASGVGPAVDVFQISAHSVGASPGAAKGSMAFKRIGTQTGLRADVTCLQVHGNVAQVTGYMTRPGMGQPAGTRVVAVFVDVGDGPDLVRFTWGNVMNYPFGPDGCYVTYDPVPTTKGNVVVNDAP